MQKFILELQSHKLKIRVESVKRANSCPHPVHQRKLHKDGMKAFLSVNANRKTLSLTRKAWNSEVLRQLPSTISSRKGGKRGEVSEKTS